MVKAIVGANWGDEGKGKVTDMLAEKADVIIRYQGGFIAKRRVLRPHNKRNRKRRSAGNTGIYQRT